MFRRFRNPARRPDNYEQAQAAQLLSQNRPGDAAIIYARLAGQMEAANHPRRAANLHAQAAHAYTASRDVANLLIQARDALDLFIQCQMQPRLTMFFGNLTRRLRNAGMQATAEVLEKEYGLRIGALPIPPAANSTTRRSQLPAACPQCGAPLRMDKIDWIDESTAECAYCGAFVRSS